MKSIGERGQRISSPHRKAFGIALIYFLVSMLWIFGTGSLLNLQGLPLPIRNAWELGKGSFFVVATSLLIYFLSHHSLRVLSDANDRLVEGATRQSRLLEELQISESYYRSVVENMGSCYTLQRIVRDENGNCVNFELVDANSAFAELVGQPMDGIRGRLLSDLIPRDRFMSDVWMPMAKEVMSSRNPGLLPRYQASNGRWYVVRVYAPADGELVGILSDINDLVLQQETVQYANNQLIEHQRNVIQLLYHDDWTGLQNRRMLREYLASYLGIHQKHFLTLMYVDLDNFKYVNDTKGHVFGDLFIKAVAERLNTQKPDGWLLYRMGGDEFILCYPGPLPRSELETLCARLQDIFLEPFDTRLGTMYGSASVGVARYPEDADNADDLLRYADIAMYRSKMGGRKSFTLFEHAMIEPVSRRLLLEDGLRTALAADAFELAYQPQLSLSDDRIIGFEALLRWRHPEIGPISPAEFIPVAEESKLIVPMGGWVLRESCRFLTVLKSDGHTGMKMAVNLSMLQLLQEDFFETVDRIVREAGLIPSDIEFEITETILMDAHTRVLPMLARLRGAGFHLALDDFGKGYSSLSYLRTMPLSMLKIDKSFVDELETEGSGRTLFGKILELGHTLGFRVVAEGVETLTQKKALEQLGCDVLQGYWFSRPLRGEDARRLLGEHIPRSDSD